MTEPEWHIRTGRPADRDLLAGFTCADPALGWQVEVERFVRTQLIDWTFDPHAVSGDPRLLLAFVAATEELFGVAAHERVVLESPTRSSTPPSWRSSRSPRLGRAAGSARANAPAMCSCPR
jgi:hypothetical protein